MTLRAAVVGHGLAGRVFHAPFLAADDRFELAAIVTGDADRARAAAERHPAARIHADTTTLLAQADELDVVVIATPPATHARLAHEAIDHGLAVVVDKPFAVTAAEGRAVIDHAAAAGVALTVFQNRRWDADFLTLAGVLEAGRLGEVRRFESRFERWQPTVTRRGWKREAGPDAGGGILYDLGTHLIDQAVRLCGPVVESWAEIDAHRLPGIDDDVFVALRHESGVRSHLWMNATAAQAGPRFRVLGSEAAYTSWGLDGQEAALAAGMAPTDPAYGVVGEDAWGLLGSEAEGERVPALRGRYDAFWAGLAAALLDDGPLPVDPEDAVATLAIIEDLHRRFGRPE